jgi:hypothetical protein
VQLTRPDDGGSKNFRNIADYMMQQPRRQPSSYLPPQNLISHVCAFVSCGVQKSLRCVSLKLQIRKSTVHDVLFKKLHHTAYKLQVVQHITACDRQKIYDFMALMCERLEADSHLFNKIMFSNFYRFQEKLTDSC